MDFKSFEEDRLKKLAEEQQLQANLMQEKKDMAAMVLEQQQRAKAMGRPFEAKAAPVAASPKAEVSADDAKGGTDVAGGIGALTSIANLAGASNPPSTPTVQANAGKVGPAQGLTGAATGATIGSAGGPIGAVIGAVVGLTAGLLGASAQSKKQKAAAKAQATNEYYESQKKINEELTRGSTNQFSQLMQSYGRLV